MSTVKNKKKDKKMEISISAKINVDKYPQEKKQSRQIASPKRTKSRSQSVGQSVGQSGKSRSNQGGKRKNTVSEDIFNRSSSESDTSEEDCSESESESEQDEPDENEIKETIIVQVKSPTKQLVEVPIVSHNVNLTCQLCFLEKSNIVFNPCGHLFCCSLCSSELNNCAICRREIIQKILVYYS